MLKFIKGLFRKKYTVVAIDYSEYDADLFILGKYNTVEEALSACSSYIKQDLENRRAYIDE